MTTAGSARLVEVRIGTAPNVDVDVVAVPIEASLKGELPEARALLAADGPVPPSHPRAALDGVRGKHPDGVAPVSIVLARPAPGTTARLLAFVVIIDDRPRVRDRLPNSERVRAAARELFSAVEALENVTSCAVVRLPGDGELATRLACEALRDHWAAHPASTLSRVVFIEQSELVARSLFPVVRELFPEAHGYLRSHEHEASADDMMPFGLDRTVKHSSVVDLLLLGEGPLGGSPVPLGATGVSFRYGALRRSSGWRVLVDARPPVTVWLDGTPLVTPRVSLEPGHHIVAVESGGGAARIEVTSEEHKGLVLRAVPDGNVVATTEEPLTGWQQLDGRRAGFEPVRAGDGGRVVLPAGPRVRWCFTFPVVTRAQL